MVRSLGVCKMFFSNQGLSIKIEKIWVTGAFNEKMLILHEDDPFHMVMWNINGLTTF